jgi:hypothetical protein
MALNSLLFHQTSGIEENRAGGLIYDGNAAHYHEWDFRASVKVKSAKDADKPTVMGKIVEGLTGDAMTAAMEIGMDKLLEASGSGLDVLKTAIRRKAFPQRNAEARMLLRKGQEINGPMARQNGESMTNFIRRRKRWWSALQKIDPKLAMSDEILGSLLLELSNLTYMEQQLVMTTTEGGTKGRLKTHC